MRRNLGANIVMVILVGLAGLCVYEGKIESVIFDKGHGTLVLRRTSSACEQKQTYHVSSAHKADARSLLVSLL